MEPEARFTAIGAMLLALLVAAAAATVWLTRSGPRADLRYYTIYFERQSLQGLQVGGDVEMRGVQVGRVERFSIARDNINRVQVTIRIDGRTPVSTNTVAVVGRKILTGLARIDLVTPGEPGPELTAVRFRRKISGDRRRAIGPRADRRCRERPRRQGRERAEERGRAAQRGEPRGDGRDPRQHPRHGGRPSRRPPRVRNASPSARTRAASEASVTLRDLSRAAAALERTADVGVNELRATAQELRSSAEIVARTADRLDNPRTVIFGPSPSQLGPGEKLR